MSSLQSSFNTFLSQIELHDQSQIFSYVEDHKAKWLSTVTEDSIFIRKDKSKLPFSLEFWKDGTWLIHTKEIKDCGSNKKVLISVDLIKKCFYARLKPKFSDSQNEQNVRDEALKIKLFEGCRGVIQICRLSDYESEDGLRKKCALIEGLYDVTFNKLYKMQLSLEEITKIALDLMTGLASIHQKGFIHRDLKEKNIVVKLDQNEKVVEAVICDLGCLSDGKEFDPPLTKDEIIQAQSKEVGYLMALFQNLYCSHQHKFPEQLEEFVSFNGQIKKSINPQEILELINSFYRLP